MLALHSRFNPGILTIARPRSLTFVAVDFIECSCSRCLFAFAFWNVNLGVGRLCCLENTWLVMVARGVEGTESLNGGNPWRASSGQLRRADELDFDTCSVLRPCQRRSTSGRIVARAPWGNANWSPNFVLQVSVGKFGNGFVNNSQREGFLVGSRRKTRIEQMGSTVLSIGAGKTGTNELNSEKVKDEDRKQAERDESLSQERMMEEVKMVNKKKKIDDSVVLDPRSGWFAKLKAGAGGLFRLWPGVPLKEEYLVVTRDSTGPSFEWEGWGTSLCWWANFTGGLPASDMDYILDLLFDPQKGLGLNIVRYNIGGGADLTFDTNMRAFANVPGYKGGASAPYDWSVDKRQRAVLFGAKCRGANLFEAFSNSPPAWMTFSGSVTGNWRKGQDNLNPLYFDAFADYLTEIVKKFETDWGLHFHYLAPFNEPVEGFWNIDRKKPAQEGCNFSVSSINKIIPEVKRRLSQKGLSTALSGFDAWSRNTPKVLRELELQAMESLDQINVHTYIPFVQFEDDARRKEVKEIVSGLGKRLWMSEYGPLNWGGREFDIALAVARHITLDINELQPSAWCYWQVLEVPGSFWGLLQAQFSYSSPFSVILTKQYYVMMQFTRWIRPGFIIYSSRGDFRDCLVSAVDSLTKETVVMVFSNTTDRNRDINFDVSSVAERLAGSQLEAALVRTSETENHKELAAVKFDSTVVLVRLIAKSVTTIVISKQNPSLS